MTPAARAALVARAKSLAVPVASRVAARIRPDSLLVGLSWEELAALVVVLADAADPVALREVTAPEGSPAPARPVQRTPREAPWRQLPAVSFQKRSGPRRPRPQPCGTYAAFRRHQDNGEPVDDACRNAARTYWKDRKRVQKASREEAGHAA